jgi:hypothetical protein
MVYDTLRRRESVAAIEPAREAMKGKGIDDTERAIYREFVAKFHNLLQHMGRRGQLEKIGEGQGARWKLAPIEPDLI